MMYESDACFVSQPGHIINGLENIRQGLQSFIDMNGKLDTKVKGVIQTSDIALVNKTCINFIHGYQGTDIPSIELFHI